MLQVKLAGKEGHARHGHSWNVGSRHGGSRLCPLRAHTPTSPISISGFYYLTPQEGAGLGGGLGRWGVMRTDFPGRPAPPPPAYLDSFLPRARWTVSAAPPGSPPRLSLQKRWDSAAWAGLCSWVRGDGGPRAFGPCLLKQHPHSCSLRALWATPLEKSTQVSQDKQQCCVTVN